MCTFKLLKRGHLKTRDEYNFIYFVVGCMLTGLPHSLEEMMYRMTAHCSQDGATIEMDSQCITEEKKVSVEEKQEHY